MKWRLDPGQIEVVDDAVAEVLRKKTSGQRMAMVGEAWESARAWIEGSVRSQHQDWSEEQIMAQVRWRLTGESD